MEKHGLKPAQLAAKAGVSRQRVYAWMKGENVSEANLEALAKILGVTKSYLRDGEAETAQWEDYEVLAQVVRAVEEEAKAAGVELTVDVRILIYKAALRISSKIGYVDRAIIADIVCAAGLKDGNQSLDSGS